MSKPAEHCPASKPTLARRRQADIADHRQPTVGHHRSDSGCRPIYFPMVGKSSAGRPSAADSGPPSVRQWLPTNILPYGRQIIGWPTIGSRRWATIGPTVAADQYTSLWSANHRLADHWQPTVGHHRSDSGCRPIYFPMVGKSSAGRPSAADGDNRFR